MGSLQLGAEAAPMRGPAEDSAEGYIAHGSSVDRGGGDMGGIPALKPGEARIAEAEPQPRGSPS